MKEIIMVLMSAMLAVTGCSSSQTTQEEPTVQQEQSIQTEQTVQTEQTEPKTEEEKVLVAFFSNTGNTENIAKIISEYTGADLFEIEAADPYTADDLDYNDSGSRTSIEQNDDSARPEISSVLENAGDYDTVFIGYPIWWGQAPKIMYTFVESYDFSDAVVIPFCTSGGSGIGDSAVNLQEASGENTNWLGGQRFSGSADAEEIQNWIDGLEY